MLKFFEERATMAIIIVSIFSLLTRTTEVITALLIYLFVSNLPIYNPSKKVMTILSNINLVMSILFGLFTFLMFVLRITAVVEITKNFVLLSVIIAVPLTLFHLVMFIVYLFKEKRELINNFFAISLILPMCGVLYHLVETLTVNGIYSFFLNLQSNGSSFGSMTVSQSGFFSLAQTILLVYLVARPQKEPELME